MFFGYAPLLSTGMRAGAMLPGRNMEKPICPGWWCSRNHCGWPCLSRVWGMCSILRQAKLRCICCSAQTLPLTSRSARRVTTTLSTNSLLTCTARENCRWCGWMSRRRTIGVPALWLRHRPRHRSGQSQRYQSCVAPPSRAGDRPP